MPRTHLLLSLPDPAQAEFARQLLRARLPECHVLDEPRTCREAAVCRWLGELPGPQAGQVQALLSEAVDVLERSRHAFKSPALAHLRKRLCRLLEELSNAPDSRTS